MARIMVKVLDTDGSGRVRAAQGSGTLSSADEKEIAGVDQTQ